MEVGWVTEVFVNITYVVEWMITWCNKQTYKIWGVCHGKLIWNRIKIRHRIDRNNVWFIYTWHWNNIWMGVKCIQAGKSSKDKLHRLPKPMKCG